MIEDDDLALSGEAVARASAWSAGSLPNHLLQVAAAGTLFALMMIMVWLQPRPDFWVAVQQPFFWLKVFYPLTLSAVALVELTAVTRPGALVWPALAAGGAVIAAMTIASAVELPGLDAAMRTHIFDPCGALACMVYTAALAAPMLLASWIGLRRVGLHRPGVTGLLVGLFCGAVASGIYSLHCTDSTFLFVTLWYTAAIVLCGAVGAVGLKLVNRCPQPDPAGS